jgi:hypothetical protein
LCSEALGGLFFDEFDFFNTVEMAQSLLNSLLFHIQTLNLHLTLINLSQLLATLPPPPFNLLQSPLHSPNGLIKIINTVKKLIRVLRRLVPQQQLNLIQVLSRLLLLSLECKFVELLREEEFVL